MTAGGGHNGPLNRATVPAGRGAVLSTVPRSAVERIKLAQAIDVARKLG